MSSERDVLNRSHASLSALAGFDLLARRAEELVTLHGAVPRPAMKAFRLHLASLLPHLVERGLEVTATIRRPLGQQLVALARDGVVPAKGIEKRVFGSTGPEVKRTLAALVAEGKLVRVTREAGPAFSLAPADVLERREIDALLRTASKLQKLVRSGLPKKAATPGILRGDIEALVRQLLVGIAPGAPEQSALAVEIARRAQLSEVPLRVPELLRSLGAPVADAVRALLEGASRGLFDLEPESGMARLSREDAELCPKGPMGTRLSWVRARPSREGAAAS